jgi:hypothetical protein
VIVSAKRGGGISFVACVRSCVEDFVMYLIYIVHLLQGWTTHPTTTYTIEIRLNGMMFVQDVYFLMILFTISHGVSTPLNDHFEIQYELT